MQMLFQIHVYTNMFQALLHASVACSLKPSIQWIAASDLEDATATSVSPKLFVHNMIGSSSTGLRYIS